MVDCSRFEKVGLWFSLLDFDKLLDRGVKSS